MEDRSVEFPQRYQLKKVEGTDDIYDLIPAPGTITAEGTLINKKALLQDATAALFQLSGDTALPDKVFEILSKAAILGDGGGLVTPGGVSVPQIKAETGTYMGTGDNTVSISFSFTPDFWGVYAYKDTGNNTLYILSNIIPWGVGGNITLYRATGASSNGVSVSYSGDSVTLNGAPNQSPNYNGLTYYYFAFKVG